MAPTIRALDICTLDKQRDEVLNGFKVIDWELAWVTNLLATGKLSLGVGKYP